MIRALRWLLGKRYARGGFVGSVGRFTPIELVTGATNRCDTCHHATKSNVYGLTDDAIHMIGTYCPNCPPQEDHE